MNGYSKIKVVRNESSRSMDSSDLIIMPQTPEPKEEKKNQEMIIMNQMVMRKNSRGDTQDSSSEQEDQEQEQEGKNNGEMFGPKLRRNSSVSSAYAIQAAVKRVFSMRRSSSVSERYCRIHDQSVTLASPFDDDEEWVTTGTRRSVNNKKEKKNSRSKILKAWKKLFGL